MIIQKTVSVIFLLISICLLEGDRSGLVIQAGWSVLLSTDSFRIHIIWNKWGSKNAVIPSLEPDICISIFALQFLKNVLKELMWVWFLTRSGSIGNKTYVSVKTFATELLQEFQLSESETHTGVTVYSTVPKLVIKMNEFYDLQKFSTALSNRTR